MSKHWRPGGKVIRGRFDRSGGDWLSADAYRALSPNVRRELNFERAKQRHDRRFRPARGRSPKGHFARQRLAWLAVAFGLTVAFTQVDLSDPQAALSTQAVRADFSLCKWGGGTNCVVDGDTFWIGGEKVRIAGIDAPETHPPHCAYEAQLGDAATDKLRALLNSGAVTLTSLGSSIDRDRYGRLLRNVAVDGADVGEAMVGAGVARDYGRGRRGWCG